MEGNMKLILIDLMTDKLIEYNDVVKIEHVIDDYLIERENFVYDWLNLNRFKIFYIGGSEEEK